MFEQDLLTYLNANFGTNIYFGQAPENVSSPYIVMFVLNRDGVSEFAGTSNDYTSGGESFIQWNVYAKNPKYALKICNDLDVLITNIRCMSVSQNSYDLSITAETGSLSFAVENGLSVSVLAKTLNYRRY